MSCLQKGVNMNETDIRKYAGLMQELGLTGLEITEDNKVVRLERTVQNVVCEQLTGTAPVPAASERKQSSSDCISVKSPIVGVFYSAPAENAEPFVTLGQRVEKGSTLCIIEAMKLMNEIESEYDGVVKEILIENGQMAEYGQPLFVIG